MGRERTYYGPQEALSALEEAYLMISSHPGGEA